MELPKLVAKEIMSWTIAWLYFYEAWLQTGKWFGPESHHTPNIIKEDKDDQKVPFDSNYTTARKFEKTAFYCLLFSAIAILYLWLIHKVEPLISFKISTETIIDLVKVLSYVSMIGYIELSSVAKYLFYSAEKVKRSDLIDNSLEHAILNVIQRNTIIMKKLVLE